MTGGEDIYLSSEDYRCGGGHACADQDFIAHARQDVPRLIAEVERLRASIEERSHRIRSADLAALIVDALMDAKIVRNDHQERALKITTEEIDVRKALGD